MDERSIEDERPYLRREPSPLPWVALVLAVALAGGTAYYYFRPQPAREAPPAAPKLEPAPAPQAEAPPAIRNPLPQAAGESLPTLDNSDSMMRDSIAALLGRKAFDELVIPNRLIRRIVATVDNLPRRTAPRRMMPLHPVAGAFLVAGSGEERTPAEANAARYAAYVRAFESVEPRALVSAYVREYPLFQRAYEELGYGGQYFNDRLLEAIDDLLAAPELATPIRLRQPKVLYEFADPEIEERSAGQKILVRMGTQNARSVKAKLREIRQALVAAGAPPR